jgi:histone H3/H4
VNLNKMRLLMYMVINMSELPIVPFGRIIKNVGGKRIGEDAKEALENVVEESADSISRQAVLLARHAGRVTVYASDIELAVKELS